MTVGIFFLLLPISITAPGGFSGMQEALPPSYFDLTAIGWQTIFTYFLLFFFGLMIGQDIWQRVFTARSPEIARWGSVAAYVAQPLDAGQRLRPCGERGAAAGDHGPGPRGGACRGYVHRQRRPPGLVHPSRQRRLRWLRRPGRPQQGAGEPRDRVAGRRTALLVGVVTLVI